ncbi:MAG: carboxymuconolactone decarboxylase family protein [Caulobacterales bacterium]|nr:carboxymuconolactone decarboxylase family protein [Caulobacterales bacterium]
MPIVAPLRDHQIEPGVLAEAQYFSGTLGIIPNSVRTMSRKPNIAHAYIALNKAVMTCEGAVTPEFKRLLGYMASRTSGCLYCQAHTILAAERFGSSEERLDAVSDYAASPLFSAAEKAALAFAEAAAAVPNAVDEPVARALRAHWNESDIIEIMAVVALFGFLNRWNASLALPLEDLPIAAANKYLVKLGWSVGKHR